MAKRKKIDAAALARIAKEAAENGQDVEAAIIQAMDPRVPKLEEKRASDGTLENIKVYLVAGETKTLCLHVGVNHVAGFPGREALLEKISDALQIADLI